MLLLTGEQVEQRAKTDFLVLHDKNVTCCAVSSSSSRCCLPVRWWCKLLCWLLLIALCTGLLVGFLQANTHFAPFDSICSSVSDASAVTSVSDDVSWSTPNANVTTPTSAYGTNFTTTQRSDRDNKETTNQCINLRKYFAGK